LHAGLKDSLLDGDIAHTAAVAKKISLDVVSDAAERVIRKDPKLLLEILLSGEEVVSC
jgi:hypothetical protein